FLDIDPNAGSRRARGDRARKSSLVREGAVRRDSGRELRREDQPRPPPRVLHHSAAQRITDPALAHHHELEADARTEPFPTSQRMPELGVLGLLPRREESRRDRLEVVEPAESPQAHLDRRLAPPEPDPLEIQ